MMIRDNVRTIFVPQATVGVPLPTIFNRLLRVVELWLARRRQRRGLLELSDHMLKDIGISRCEAVQEGDKPFWRR